MLIAGGSLEKTLADLSDQNTEKTLVVCDGSRSDLLLGLSAAHSSRGGPHIAGVLVTHSSAADSHVAKILQVLPIVTNTCHFQGICNLS